VAEMPIAARPEIKSDAIIEPYISLVKTSGRVASAVNFTVKVAAGLLSFWGASRIPASESGARKAKRVVIRSKNWVRE
jgi:hypothetical protein